MPLKMSPAARKAAIRAILVQQAQANETITYKRLGVAIDGPARGPWKRVLDAIRDEENAQKRPDITSLVVSNATQFPTYIPKDTASRDRSMQERQRVFDYYSVAQNEKNDIIP